MCEVSTQERIEILIEYIKFCNGVLNYEDNPTEIDYMWDAIRESRKELKELGYPEWETVGES